MDIVEDIKLVLELVTKSQKLDADSRSKSAGYTKANVGSGYGKMAGGMAAGLPGMVIGHYVGKNLGDKDRSANLTKKTDRVGVLLDKTRSLKQAAAAGKGAALGAGVGAVASALNNSDPGAGLAVGGIGGAAAGAMGSAIKAGYRHAKKMGYGKAGRVGAAVTPLAGLTKPKSQRDAKRSDIKGALAAQPA